MCTCRSPPRSYYSGDRRRATPPRTGTHLFVAGLNFITNERVPPASLSMSCCVTNLKTMPLCSMSSAEQCRLIWHVLTPNNFAHFGLQALCLCSVSSALYDYPRLACKQTQPLECVLPPVQEVENKFTKFGDVRMARIVRNPYNNESRGFGFVEMADEDGTDRVRAPFTSEIAFYHLSEVMIVHCQCFPGSLTCLAG